MKQKKTRDYKQRYFEGLPVREGRGDILVQPNKQDLARAIKHDPENCAYAICMRRMFETKRVFIYTTIAYVQTLDEQGNPIMERYVVKNHAHAYIRAFDNGQDVGPGGFLLHKPTGSNTLEYKRVQTKEYAQKNKEKVRRWAKQAYEKQRAKSIKKKNWNPPRLQSQYTETTFRDGKGQVHFVGLGGILTVKKEIES